MKVIQRGHVYELDHRGAGGPATGCTTVRFVNLEPGTEREGVTTQELVRMLIDRTTYCNNCLPHRVNEEIIWHFRQVIALHESRALEQAAKKGEYRPEMVNLNDHGHFDLTERATASYEETVLKPVPPVGEEDDAPCHGCQSREPLWPPGPRLGAPLVVLAPDDPCRCDNPRPYHDANTSTGVRCYTCKKETTTRD